jgi:hypothetical protein
MIALFFSLALGSGAAISSFEWATSDVPEPSQSDPSPKTDDRKKLIVLCVVLGMCGVAAIVLVVLCFCNRTPIQTVPEPPKHKFEAFWRTYTDVEDLSAASAWSDQSRSAVTLMGQSEGLCPICHGKHGLAVDLGLPREMQDCCLKAPAFPQ